MKSASQIKDHWREQRLFSTRIIVCTAMAAILIGIVFARLVVLQLVDADYYAAQSQGNRIRVEPLPPTRGLIYDRNLNILAENTPSYQLEITPEQVADLDDTLARLEQHGLIKSESLDRARNLIDSKRRFDSIPIRQRMSDEEVARFAVLRPYFPGVEIRARLAQVLPLRQELRHTHSAMSAASAPQTRRYWIRPNTQERHI